MKKNKLSLILIFSWFCVQGIAEIRINWGNFTEPVYQANGTDLAPTSYFAQLIYSPTEFVYSSINISNPLNVDPGFEIISSQLLPFDGYIFQYPAITTNNSLLNGWVYTRVFSTATPDTSSFYGQSSNFTKLTSIYNPLNPVGTTMTHDPLDIIVSIPVIPEPASVALVGVSLSAVIFGLRRRRYRI